MVLPCHCSHILYGPSDVTLCWSQKEEWRTFIVDIETSDYRWSQFTQRIIPLLSKSLGRLEHMGTSETANSESFEQSHANQIVGTTASVKNLITALYSKRLPMMMCCLSWIALYVQRIGMRWIACTCVPKIVLLH